MGGAFVTPDLSIAERVRRGHALHTTLVRNEHAYYCCIAQLTGYLQRGVSNASAIVIEGLGPALQFPSNGAAPAEPLYVMGDSHTLCPTWHRIQVAGRTRLLVPALVTGLKAWHLRPESTFYPKRNFEAVRANLPRGAQVVMLFCEIDCRERLLIEVERCRYESLDEAIAVVVSIYLEQLRALRDEFRLQVRSRGVCAAMCSRFSAACRFLFTPWSPCSTKRGKWCEHSMCNSRHLLLRSQEFASWSCFQRC